MNHFGISKLVESKVDEMALKIKLQTSTELFNDFCVTRRYPGNCTALTRMGILFQSFLNIENEFA